jgi:hypothetical protein
MPKDSIVRADFIQTKQMESLEKPLVSNGNILAVKDRGIVWITQNPQYMKKVYSMDENEMSRSQYAMIAPFFTGDFSTLQKRFDIELTKNTDSWNLKITPKSAAIRKNIKYITINGSSDGKSQEVLIFPADDNFVRINFTADLGTGQVLSKDEEELFE